MSGDIDGQSILCTLLFILQLVASFDVCLGLLSSCNFHNDES
jgi:hypothetical protein